MYKESEGICYCYPSLGILLLVLSTWPQELWRIVGDSGPVQVTFDICWILVIILFPCAYYLLFCLPLETTNFQVASGFTEIKHFLRSCYEAQLIAFTRQSVAHKQSPHRPRSLGIKSHCAGVKNPKIFMHYVQIITENTWKTWVLATLMCSRDKYSQTPSWA